MKKIINSLWFLWVIGALIIFVFGYLLGSFIYWDLAIHDFKGLRLWAVFSVFLGLIPMTIEACDRYKKE